MRRIVVFVAVVVAAIAMLAVPASAHYIVVDAPGGSDGHSGWVGSPGQGIPGQGEGLIMGGPGGQTVLSPSHAKGLNTACEAMRSQGRAAADIYGPPSPSGCPHGT